MLLLIAAMAAAVSGDAPATQTSDAQPPATQSSKASAPSAKDDPNRVVCRTQAVTGSRFTDRVCLTRQQWSDREQEAQRLMQRREDATGVVSHQSSPF
jgi:hypothetical protein